MAQDHRGALLLRCRTLSFLSRCRFIPALPNDASSGRQQHHRLNRYGDRHANWALHVIIISRLRWHPPTKAYIARRLAQGRSRKMIIRCLKRHVVREVHRAITTDLDHQRPPAPTSPPRGSNKPESRAAAGRRSAPLTPAHAGRVASIIS